jgi:PDZ domain
MRGGFRSRFPGLGLGLFGWWGWLWYSDCEWDAGWNWESQCGPASDLPSSETEEGLITEPGNRPVVVFFLRDGTGHAASDYWASDGVLHLQTTYGGEESFPMEELDVRRTATENAARGVYFSLSPSPDSSQLLRLADSHDQVCPLVTTQPSTSSAQPAASSGTFVFGASGSSTDQGFAVKFVRADSFAARLGIQPGDILLQVDCQPVHNDAEIESAMTANATGTVWASYLIKGAWLSEKRIGVR